MKLVQTPESHRVKIMYYGSSANLDNNCFSASPNVSIEFSLNVFTEIAEFSDKNICHYSKRAQTCHPAASCVRDQDATAVLARHMWETESLNWAHFMLQWFIRFPEFVEFSEFLFHLGKTLLSNWTDSGTLLADKMQHGIVVLALLQISSFNQEKEMFNPLSVSQ